MFSSDAFYPDFPQLSLRQIKKYCFRALLSSCPGRNLRRTIGNRGEAWVTCGTPCSH